MSKSNKEKERLAKIRAFEKGDIGFDISMLKLKLIVTKTKDNIDENNFDYNLKKIKSKVIPPEFKNEIKLFISNIIKNNLNDIKIYDFKIKIDLIILPDGLDRNAYLQICLFSENKFLCQIISKTSLIKIYKSDEKLFIDELLSSLLNNIKHKFQNVEIKSDLINTSRIKSTVFNNKKFKNCNFYQDVLFTLNYIKRNNTILKVKSYDIIYDFIDKKFSKFFVRNTYKDSFIGHNLSPSKTNLDACKMLNKIGYINFDIENMTEEEIFEMYEILNY